MESAPGGYVVGRFNWYANAYRSTVARSNAKGDALRALRSEIRRERPANARCLWC
jgi:hypothetical protein